VGGVAPPGTAGVAIRTPDGRTFEALLTDTGPRPGERVFAVFTPGTVTGYGGPPFVATAYDAAGDVLLSKPLA
jgi:hypothetical protein